MKAALLTIALITLVGLVSCVANAFLNGPVLLMTGKVGGGGTPPGSIPCVVGPNFAGTIPAPATLAGFTSCILNADFSTSSGSGASNFGNVSTFLDGCGGPTSGDRLVYRYWYAGAAPCSGAVAQVDIENDGTIGKNVFHGFQVNNDSNKRWLSITFPEVVNINENNYFPMGYYSEIMYKLSASSVVGQTTNTDVVNLFRVPGNNQPSSFEPDDLETVTLCSSGSTCQYGDGGIEWCNGTQGCTGYGFMPGGSAAPLRADQSAYHKYGALWTTDAATIISKKTYLDDANLNSDSYCQTAATCNEHSPTIGSAQLGQHDKTMILVFGLSPLLPAPGTQNNNVDIYIQYIRLWTCPGAYKTATNCTTVVL